MPHVICCPPKSTPRNHSAFSDPFEPGSVSGKWDAAKQAFPAALWTPGLSGAPGLSRVKQVNRQASWVCPEARCARPGRGPSGPGPPLCPWPSVLKRPLQSPWPRPCCPPLGPSSLLVAAGPGPAKGCPWPSPPAPCPPDSKACSVSTLASLPAPRAPWSRAPRTQHDQRRLSSGVPWPVTPLSCFRSAQRGPPVWPARTAQAASELPGAVVTSLRTPGG